MPEPLPSSPAATAEDRLSRVTGLLLFLLPTLATVALYLPGGLLMPARLVILALAVMRGTGGKIGLGRGP